MMKKCAVISALLVSFASAPAEAQGIDSLWIIKGGKFAGESVAIDRSRATKKSSRFWRISSIKGYSRIVGWNPSSLPAKVAFHDSRINAADSAAFWSIIREMERDMGMHLFEPTSLALEEDDRNIIVVDLTRMMGTQGVTYITWSSSGAPYDARIHLGSRSLLRDSRVVTHELMHALGFGHTTSWDSIMNPSPSGPTRLTAQDVAYAQAAFESRTTSEREDMWARLALAVSRDGNASDYTACADEPPGPFDVSNRMVIISAAAGLSARVGPPTGDLQRSSSCYH